MRGDARGDHAGTQTHTSNSMQRHKKVLLSPKPKLCTTGLLKLKKNHTQIFHGSTFWRTEEWFLYMNLDIVSYSWLCWWGVQSFLRNNPWYTIKHIIYVFLTSTNPMYTYFVFNDSYLMYLYRFIILCYPMDILICILVNHTYAEVSISVLRMQLMRVNYCKLKLYSSNPQGI